MLKGIRIAYGAGYRAGMAEPVVMTRPDGLKQLEHAACPYVGRFQGLQRMAWLEGNITGQRTRLQRWNDRMSTVRSARGD